MTMQTKLFEPAEFEAEPWQVPANLKRIEFIPWVKQKAVELARRWHVEECRVPLQHYDSKEDWLEWDFARGKTQFEGDDENLIETWLRTQYEEELRNEIR